MVRMLVRHDVTEYDVWREVYDSFDRAALDVTDHAAYRSVDDPNDITVSHDFASADAARAFAFASELESAMRRARVTSASTIWFTTPS